MTIAQLRAVAEVIASGSVSVAAERLFLSQPAVTKQIRALEAELGQRLFARVGRRVQPTPEAHRLLPRVEALIRGMENLRLAAPAPSSRQISGYLRVGCGTVFAQTQLPPVVAEYRRRHPQIEVILHELSIREQVERLRQGELRVSFGPSYVNDIDLHFTPLLKDELVLVVPVQHRLAKGTRRLRLADVVGREPLLTHLYAGGVEAELRKAGIPRQMLQGDPRVGVRTTNTVTLVALATAGLGVAVVPGYLARWARRPEAVVRRILPKMPMDFGYYQLKGAIPNPAEASWIELVRAALAPQE